MGNSLQDQFLKLGLVDKKKAGAAKKKKHKQKKAPLNNNAVNQNKAAVQTRQKQKKDYERLLKEERAREQEKKEKYNRLCQLIEQHKLENTNGDIPYKFTDDNKVRKLFTTREITDQLSKGKLAIIKKEKDYFILPSDTGNLIQDFAPDHLVVLHHPSKDEKEDDLYAEYKIPDDLVW